MNDIVKEDPRLTALGYAVEYASSRSLLTPDQVKHDLRILRWGDEGLWSEGYLAGIVQRISDGQILAVEGACDYTGWDCQAYLDVTEHDTVEAAFWHGVTQEGRAVIEKNEG